MSSSKEYVLLMTYNTIKRESNLISPNEEKTTEQNKSTEIVFFFAKDQKDEGISLLYFICVIWFFIIKAMPITSFSVLFISFFSFFFVQLTHFENYCIYSWRLEFDVVYILLYFLYSFSETKLS